MKGVLMKRLHKSFLYQLAREERSRSEWGDAPLFLPDNKC